MRATGLPYSRLPRGREGLARLGERLAAVAALVTCIAAAIASWNGFPNAGVVIDEVEGVVVQVDPWGFVWSNQVRAGDRFIATTSREDPVGWGITIDVGGDMRTVRESNVVASLRRTFPIAIAGLAACLVGIGLLRLRYRASALAFVGAVLLASTPLGFRGDPITSTASLGLAAFLPLAWIAGRRPLGSILGGLVLLGAATFVGTWAVARLSSWTETYESLEAIRSAVEFGGLGAVALGVIALPVLRRELPTISPREIADFTGLAILGGVSIAIVVVLDIEPIAVAIMAVAVVAIFPRWQRVMTVVADRLLLSDLREQAAIEATEEERARLARDIHDVPLQQIAGVIRRLETAPELHDAGDDLRAVADQLRAVATDLRPPVLDDLGLGAALSFLADRATTDETQVVARFEDATGLGADERAPAGVELAVFRIAEEAVNNAKLHADATEISIEGELAPTRLRIRVRDNGVGLSQAAMAAAAGRGRLGLASMRRRAALIGGELELSSSGGAIVEIRWPR